MTEAKRERNTFGMYGLVIKETATGDMYVWAQDNVVFPPEGGMGTDYYSVYKIVTSYVRPSFNNGNEECSVIVPVEGKRNLTSDKENIPEGYEVVLKPSGLYSFEYTNDVINITPKTKEPEKDETKEPVKNLTNSDSGVKIEFTNGLDDSAELKITKVDQSSMYDELKKDLTGLLFVYDISVYNNDVVTPISGNEMKIRIPLTEEMKNYSYYQVAYIKDGEVKERIKATAENGDLVFTTTHLSEYAVLGSSTPFAENSTPDNTDKTQTGDTDKTQTGDTDTTQTGTTDTTQTGTTDTTQTDATAATQATNTDKTTTGDANPQTGDSNVLLICVILMLASGSAMFLAWMKMKRKQKEA